MSVNETLTSVFHFSFNWRIQICRFPGVTEWHFKDMHITITCLKNSEYWTQFLSLKWFPLSPEHLFESQQFPNVLEDANVKTDLTNCLCADQLRFCTQIAWQLWQYPWERDKWHAQCSKALSRMNASVQSDSQRTVLSSSPLYPRKIRSA